MSLFGNQERVYLFTRTAPAFFQVCQTTFTDDVFLALSRITDSPKTSGQKNLIIGRIIETLDATQHPVLYEDMTKLITAATEACQSFKLHRHKRLAHNDLNFKLQTTTKLLPGIPIAEINRAIESLQDVLNAFNRYFFEKEISFKVIENGGVEALVIYLQKGVEAFNTEKQQALSGIAPARSST